MDKLKMHSLDGVERNIERIGKLFPNAMTEAMRGGKVVHAIDFDVLRQELSDAIVEGREETLSVHMAGQEKGHAGGQCAHYGNAAPGKSGQRGQGWHAWRL